MGGCCSRLSVPSRRPAPGVGPQPACGDHPSERSRALDAPPRPWWFNSWLLGFPYAVSTGAVLSRAGLSLAELVGQPGWARWGCVSRGWWGPSEAAGPSVRFSPLEAADEQSIFLSLALTEQRGLEFAGLSIPA